MASHHPSKFTSKTPHFFKVILEETIRDGKLGIPRKFVKEHGNQLPNTIQLEVPSGETWKVELTRCDEGVRWLRKGWPEFAEHYSLKFGYFLVFRYDGNGYFHVLVFDKSTSEIEYPHTNTEDEHDDDMPVNVGRSDDVSASKKSKEKSDLPCPRPQKKRRTDSPDQPGTDEFLSCKQMLTTAEKARAIQIASSFKCTGNGNPVFMVVMQPSFLRNRYRMGIPSNFDRKFLTKQNANLTLCDSAGKTWTVKYHPRSGKVSYMHFGWRAFAEDNNLVVGDVCVFELIEHRPEILFKVAIYPVAEKNASKACRPLSDGSIGSRVKVRSLVGNAERNCRQTQCPSSSREFRDPKIEDIEVLDNFPLNQKTKKKLPAPCFQHCKMMRTNPSGSIQAKGIKLVRYKKRLNSRYLTKARASTFNSTNPSFALVMQPSYVLSWFNLHIPNQFAKRYFEKNGEVTLRVSDGRTWIVDYRVCRYYGRARFDSNNWKAFVVDNKLKVGDTCVFKLIKENGILLEVAILPAAGCSSSKLGSTS